LRLSDGIAEPFTVENLSFRQQREPERRSKSNVLISEFFPVNKQFDFLIYPTIDSRAAKAAI